MNKSVYLPNINSIRFIAAAMVIANHSNQIMGVFGFPNYGNSPFGLICGKLGVVLFFVLSGFLITYLLFKEIEVTSTVSIKDFYIRRVLRIWPLYFLIVGLSLFVMPHLAFFRWPGQGEAYMYSHYSLKIVLYCLILPNMVLSIFSEMQYVSVTWSIGAEEQFYLIWPVLMKKIKNKLAFMIAVIAFYGIIKFTLNHFASHDNQMHLTLLDIFNRFWALTPIDCMATGGIFALIGYSKNKAAVAIKKLIFKKWFQLIVLLLTITMMARGVYIPHIQYECYSVLFGIILINLALNEKNILNLEYPVLNYLGKISYGLYMYHSIVIVVALKILMMLGLVRFGSVYILSILLTIVLAGLSYRFYEKPFIARKIRFSKIVSGDNANELQESKHA